MHQISKHILYRPNSVHEQRTYLQIVQYWCRKHYHWLCVNLLLLPHLSTIMPTKWHIMLNCCVMYVASIS